MARPGPRQRRLTSAHIISFIALFVALGGGAYAAIAAKNTVNSNSVVDSSLLSKDVKNNNLTGGDLKNDTVTGQDVKEGSLGVVPNAANAAKLGGAAPGAFASNAAIHRAQTSLTDTTNDASPVTTQLDSDGTFTVTASCNRSGANVTGLAVITSSAAGWSLDSSGTNTGAPNNKDRTNIGAGTGVQLLGFGPTNARHMGHGSFAAHDGTAGITGIASVEVNHDATAGRCDFAYSRSRP
jgi:hypothetical protein